LLQSLPSPFAIVAVAISKTTGSLFLLGQAIEIGLVPKKASLAPAGATDGLKAVQAKAN
jgi:hypothetical protein